MWEANPATQVDWYLNDVLSNQHVTDVEISRYEDSSYPDFHYTYNTISTIALRIDFAEHQDAILRCNASNIVLPDGLVKKLTFDVAGNYLYAKEQTGTKTKIQNVFLR